MKTNQTKIILYSLVFLFLIPSFLSAAPVRNLPKTITLPDNSIINCFESGDEFFNWLHDENGYTLLFGADGFLYYAIKDQEALIPSDYRYNSINPETVGIQPGNLISQKAYEQRREKFFSFEDNSKSVISPHFGFVNNLVVFVRFSDDNEFTDTLSNYDNLFNETTLFANSMRRYFYEVSYNQLTFSSTFYPVTQDLTVLSYQDDHPRGYYMQFNFPNNIIGYLNDEEKADRERTLIKNAAASISDQVPAGLDIDANNDGYVDNMCFILKGFTDHEILWPHKWNLGTGYEVYINNLMVYYYNIQVQEHLQVSGNKVLCHEMSHTIGFPDLYHGSDWWYLRSVAPWDPMDGSLDPPPHLCAYTKWDYGWWIAQPLILASSGYYTLKPLNSSGSPNIYYRINLPQEYGSQEYYIVEYRRKTGTFESSLPGNGMIIYRINPEFTGNNGFNGIDVFDEVYAYRPDGTTIEVGNTQEANYSQLVGRTTMNCSTNPPPFLSNGDPGSLFITDITDNDGTLTFLLIINEPDNLTLNQSNTSGLFAASDNIYLQNGFNTTPSNSFRAITTKCTDKGYSSYPHFEFIEVNTFDQSNQKTNSFYIQYEIGTYFDINTIRNQPDNNNNYLAPGTYEYVAKRDGIEIENGTLVIEQQ